MSAFVLALSVSGSVASAQDASAELSAIATTTAAATATRAGALDSVRTSESSTIGDDAFDAFLAEGEPTRAPTDAPRATTRAAVFKQAALFVEAIEVVGNGKTTRDTILARISVEIGDLVDEDRIEESRLRLLGTGFFRSVEFSLRRGSQRGRVLLVVEVEVHQARLGDRLRHLAL